MLFKTKATTKLNTISPVMDNSSLTFKLSRRKSTQKVGNVSFPGNAAYGSYSIGESEVLKCSPAAYINTGKKTSPGLFHGGCPQPPTILGTWGPGSLYLWTDYLKNRNPKPVATTKNVMGLPNGLSMIHWRKNNLNSALDNSYSLEMITGWGSYSKKKIPNDYGWVNGTIFNLPVNNVDNFQVPFVHIYYREVTGNKGGVEQGKLHFWEAALSGKKQIKNVGLIYDQLKGHIDEHFDAIVSGKKYSNADIKVTEWPLSDVIDSVFYVGLDSNGQIPTVPSKYWSKNSAYPENNTDILSQNPLPD